MKKFLEMVGELKTWGCLSFTGALCCYSLIDSLTGGEYIRHTLVWQMLALCGCITLLQYVFFSGRVLKKPSYYLRMAIFCGLILILCAGFAWAFHWFPLRNGGAWISFLAIFFGIFLVFCLGFEIYFRILGRKYDQLLGRSQQRRGGVSVSKDQGEK